MKTLLAFLLLCASLQAQVMCDKSQLCPAGGGTPAAFVSSANCTTPTLATCTISSLAIPSGDLIVVANHGNTNTTLTVADSNSDTPTCTTAVASANGDQARLCIMKAGATITSVTCSQSGSVSLTCSVGWYTLGSLTGAIDQSTGQVQSNLSAWSSGSTATLAGTIDLVVGFWFSQNTGLTSTYSDGGTQRISITTPMSSGLEDRNVTGTTGVAASGTWSSTNFGAAIVMAVK